ncbi:MAG: sigma-70 family RNA polymerase sigma factor, partial [Verrucomicrobiota bacterium]
MNDETELLRRYADEGSGEAFADFVRGHLSLVYSAALRRMQGDAAGARDVAQRVFVTAAREARRLARHASVTGWLYTTTRNAALDHMRDEQRRRQRERQAHESGDLAPSAERGSGDWRQIGPVLDRTMDGLSAADREAVLLRFFEGRSFAEVGQRLKLTENAARMRVERALERLRLRAKVAEAEGRLAAASSTMAVGAGAGAGTAGALQAGAEQNAVGTGKPVMASDRTAAPGAKGAGSMLDRLIAYPEYQDVVLRQQRAAMPFKFGPLYRKLGLTGPQIAAFEDLMMEQQR